jgi:5'-3' exonuclease
MAGYKTSEGVEPDLLAQFPLLEDVLTAAGIVVWPMVKFEADDALAAVAAAAARDERVERVIICTPDKGLAQCVRGSRIVQLNRRTRLTLDEGWRGPESLVSRRHPSPTIWRWWAMRRTAIWD